MRQLELRNKNILITGGSGFIGSYLLELLIDKNQICVIDNEYRGSNIEHVKRTHPKHFKKNVQFINSDITEKNKLVRILKQFKPDLVFHLAGITGVITVLKDPMKVIDVNLIGSYNLAKAISCVDSVKKLVYASTSEVYGPSAYQLDEDSFTTQGTAYDPRWSYATSKLFAEHIFVALERQFGVDVAIGRLFNVYGPKQIGSGAIHEFVKKAIANKSLTIYDDGSQIRAWCYIHDCMSGIRLITENGHGIYNIGNPQEALTSIALARLVIDITKSKSNLIFRKLKSSDVKVRVPNIQKISKLGYKPKFTLKEGLSQTIEWYKNNINKKTKN